MVPRKYLILLALSGLIVALDQLTKNFVVARLRLGESFTVISQVFNLTRVHNTGAAFGLLASLPPDIREPFFYGMPAIVLAIILIVFYRLHQAHTLSIYALALIVGGALGNLADRLRLGFVVDFLDLHWNDLWHFPAFNLADAAISAGVALLMLGLISEREVAARPEVVS